MSDDCLTPIQRELAKIAASVPHPFIPHVCPNCGTAMTAPGKLEQEIERLQTEVATCDLNRTIRDTHVIFMTREVERLRAEATECRELLREAVEHAISDDESHPAWYGDLIPDEWFVRAAKAGGGDECSTNRVCVMPENHARH